ncbi:hypothetical protein N665_0250s0005 [Sinapis alba]|nr:hypothetical protein N665_0250s0005 [Sinapis alba]
MSSPIRHCSLKGKAITTVRRPRTIMLGGMENPRPPTGDDLAELNDNEHSVVQFSLDLENREASGHAAPDEVEHETEHRSAQMTNSGGNADVVDKDKNSAEKEMDFALADFLPMRWMGTNFKFPTRSSFKSLWRLILQTNPPAGFSFLIPASHQRPWTPPVGYACWPLPEFLTTYCSRRKITLGKYTTNMITITLTVLAAELGIKMSVRLFEELTTPSITAKTWFFYGKIVPKYNVITEKPLKVNFWNRYYFYVKINEASLEDPSVILNGYFNANIDRLGKWAQGGSESFQDQVEAIRTLTQTAVETPSRTRTQRMAKLEFASLPSYADSIGTPSHGQEGSYGGGRPAKRRRASHPDEGALNVSTRRPAKNSSPKPVDETEMVVATEEPTDEHPVDPLMESEFPEEKPQGDEFQELDTATHGDEVVEYPHVIDVRYQHTDVLFVGDHEAPFFGNANLMVRDYEVKIKGHEEKLAEKTRSLKRKRKENTELAFKCGAYEDQVGNLNVEKNEAMEKANNEKSRGKLLSKELEELKAQKELLDSRLWKLEQEKAEVESKFETTTRKLRESQEHEVRKERLRVEAALRQHVMPVYKKVRQFLVEQSLIQHKLALYSQAKGTREVLEKVRADEIRYSDELKEMEVIEASEINLQLIGLDKHGSNLNVQL